MMILALIGGAEAASPDGVGAQEIDNVRLVFQLVEANGFEGEDPEIADVVSELRQLFRFEGYRLAATGLLNLMPWSTGSTRLTGGEVGGYVVGVSAEMSEDRERMRIGVELAHENEGPAMDATVTVRDGQTLVLGSTRTYEGAALILVMRVQFR
jgi:hypothetical protein